MNSLTGVTTRKTKKWTDQGSPHLRHDTPEFYRICAKELRILFGDNSPNKVLEIGGANGALFEFLGLESVQHNGVDFSPRLVAQFKSKYPNVQLECREASSYFDLQNKYDLIF
jgi:cyclopropane fatty-acyl-phospholipid synthase-like methyltransferase